MKNDPQHRFMRLYEPIHPQFERFCRARVYGEMEPGDLINETLLRVYPKMDELKVEKALFSFLCRTAIRLLANAHRKKRTERLSESGVEEERLSISPSVEKKLEVDRLHEALAQLPVEQRESLILYEISGFSVREVAEMHGVGESAVKQRLRRGRMALAELLKERTMVGMTDNGSTGNEG